MSGPNRDVWISVVDDDGGEVGVLEITRHEDPKWRQRQSEIAKRAVDRDVHWAARRLSRYWTVGLAEPEDYRRAHGGAAPPVKELHRASTSIANPPWH